ncbi:hypothetical protein SAMN05444422_109163 [Halobiforma haloterrestris]|uniref:PAP2 superfamily protein n=1 Tax=Natronobacterium haloterrestre TaxID=148448 RepID=A0A1I1JSP4_NATHA|nr:hypothetical protein SAMN05444422_109163 [Halobiforma haloterrestris]
MSTATVFSEVFAPELFVLLVTTIVAGYELWGSDICASALAARTTTVLFAWIVAFAVYEGGSSIFSVSVPGSEDFFASIGLITGFVIIWFVWVRKGWGPLLQLFSLLLIGTSIVHMAVVPFWDVSSHVIYSAISTCFLCSLNRRFAVFLFVPIGLVWSRIAIEAHTVVEAVGGLVFAGVIIAVALRVGAVPRTRTDSFGR